MEQDNRNEQAEIEEVVEGEIEVETDNAAETAAFDEMSREALVELAKKLLAEGEECKNRYLRTHADFDNFRRRSRQEKEEFAAYANAKILEELLPVIDIFDMALKSSANTDAKVLLQGIEMVHRQFTTVLENQGLKAIDAVGQPFDPYLHEGVMNVESGDHPANTVVEELRKGYRLKERVLRPAMVKVSQ